MKLFKLILNVPWTILGIVAALISIPKKLSTNQNPPAIIYRVRSFWWYRWLPKMSGVRAMAIGNIILLGPNELEKDLEHELVHVKQFMREPFVHPFLSAIETFRKGYRENKYEKEAYEKAGNVYIERSF